MSTNDNKNGTDVNAFIRINPAVRDQLKTYCNKHGLIMGKFVSNVISRAIAPRTDPPKPGKKAARK